LQVRTVRQGGVLCWKHRNVFFTEVLEGERVGLLPLDDRWFTIFFARFPIARFDSLRRKIVALPHDEGLSLHLFPNPNPNSTQTCQPCPRSKMSGMSPAAQSKWSQPESRQGRHRVATQTPEGLRHSSHVTQR
jgi:hypothetical protein